MWELVDRAYEIDFFALRSDYRVNGNDYTQVYTTVRVPGRSHEVRDYGQEAPDRLQAYEREITSVVGSLAERVPRTRLDGTAERNWSC